MRRIQGFTRAASILAVCLAVAAPVCAASQEKANALAQIPADAPIVIHVRGIEETKDRLVTLIKNAVPDVAGTAEAKIDAAWKQGLEGRDLKAFPKAGPLFLVFTEMPSKDQIPPKMAIVAAITSYADFKSSFLKEDERKNLKHEKDGYDVTMMEGTTTFIVDHKDYVFVTPDKEAAEKHTKKFASLDTKVKGEVAKKLLGSDASVYVDMAAVNDKYGQQVKAFLPIIKFAMAQNAAKMDKNAMAMMNGFVDGFVQFLDDSRVFIGALDFKPQGLGIGLQTEVAKDSKTDSFLKAAKVGGLDKLGTLPAGEMVYSGVELTADNMRSFGKLMQGFYSGGDGETAKKWTDALAAAGPESWLMSYSMPPRGVQVFHFKDPNKAMAAQMANFEAMKSGESFQNLPLKEKPVVKPNAETYRGFKLTYVSMKWDFEKFAANAPQGGQAMADAMKKMMGEGSNSWMGTDGKQLVTVMAADWNAAKKLLNDYLDGKSASSQSPAFAETRKHLPTQATFLSLIDTPKYMQMMTTIIGPIMKAQGLPIEIPEIKATAGKSYMGMALTMQPEVGSVELWIPVSTAQEIMKMVQQATGNLQ